MKMVDYILRKHAQHMVGETEYKKTVTEISDILKNMGYGKIIDRTRFGNIVENEYEKDVDVCCFIKDFRDRLNDIKSNQTLIDVADGIAFFSILMGMWACGVLPANSAAFDIIYGISGVSMVGAIATSGIMELKTYLQKLAMSDGIRDFLINTKHTSNQTKQNVDEAYSIAIWDAVDEYEKGL